MWGGCNGGNNGVWVALLKFIHKYYSIFGKECLVFGNIICCPFRMFCLAPYTVPLGPKLCQ